MEQLLGVLVFKEQEQHKQPKVTRTWINWVPGLYIYATVLQGAQTLRGAELFVYVNTICRLHSSFAGPAWLQYNEAFRTWAARALRARWDEINFSIWIEVTSHHVAAKGIR